MAPALRLTFTAFAAGLVAITVGAGFAIPVVKLHDVVTNAAHGPSRMLVRIPDAETQLPPVITTVYTVEGNKSAVGSIVTMLVNPPKVTFDGTLTLFTGFPTNNLTLVLLTPVLTPV